MVSSRVKEGRGGYHQEYCKHASVEKEKKGRLRRRWLETSGMTRKSTMAKGMTLNIYIYIYIYIGECVCVCLSVCVCVSFRRYTRRRLWSDRDQMLHTHADSSPNGSELNTNQPRVTQGGF